MIGFFRENSLLLILLFLMINVKDVSAQASKSEDLIIGFSSLTKTDIEKIRKEIAGLNVQIGLVCYNHNAVVFTFDPDIVSDPKEVIMAAVDKADTSTSPVIKEGGRDGLICETEETKEQIERSAKQ